MSLRDLIDDPFRLLLELEAMARKAMAGSVARQESTDEWVGIGFGLGNESFVTSRGDVREVLPVPDQMTRVPGAKPWLRGIANVRGQLLTVVDLRAYLGAGSSMSDRHARMLTVASREIPTGLIVDQVSGFRRFQESEYSTEPAATVVRCERYLEGCFRRGQETWPRFSLPKLLEDEQFLNAGEQLRAH